VQLLRQLLLLLLLLIKLRNHGGTPCRTAEALYSPPNYIIPLYKTALTAPIAAAATSEDITKRKSF